MNPGTSNAGTGPMARIPTAAWVAAAALAAGLAAILVFSVPIRTVFTFGLIGLLAYIHLFMHGSHGGHGQHGAQGAQANQISEKHRTTEGEHSGHIDGPPSHAAAAPNAEPKDTHTGHSGGCC